ncbi:MAG: hypothetical protein JXA57_20120, partial [Armatimonadetes bacterium]|nr:hypothetical protein [Armatimonadota bacterium]
DGLIPVEIYAAAAAEVRAGPLGRRRHHAFWVDIPIPREAKPATYRGSVETVGGAKTEVAVEVLPLELPLVPRVTVDLNSYAKRIEEQFPGIDAAALISCEHSYYREAHDNRAVFHYLGYGHTGKVADGYSPPLTGRGRHLRVASWEAYDRRFGPLFDGTALAGSPGGERPLPHFYLPFNYDWPADFAYFGTRGYELEWTRVLAEFRCHCQEKGWTQTNFEVFNNQKKRYRFYAWDGDESKSWADREHFIFFRELLDRSARSAGPAGAQARIIYRTDSSWTFLQDALHEQVGPLFDLWVINIGNYVWSREGVEALKARGQLAWTYGTADEGGHPGQPALDLDRAIIATWRRGADGVLPNWLSTGTDADLDRANPLAMLYPGRRFGAKRALGSIRLRAIRRATQTADVLDMLGDRGRKLIDEMVGAKEEDWWTPTPAWALFPPQLMKGEMYGRQPLANPFSRKDAHLPALMAERATELALGGE